MSYEKQNESDLTSITKRMDSNGSRQYNLSTTESFDPKVESRLRSQFDRRILLCSILMFLCNFIDRSNIGNVQILGMAEDLHLHGNQINVALTAFFCVYLVFVIPCNVFCKKFGSQLWLGSLTIGVGLATMCCAFVQNFHQLVAVRCLVGMFEAGIHPGIVFTISKFYRRHELATRVGIQTSTASLGGSFSGLLAAGLSAIPPSGILREWRYVFLLEGIMTILVGCFVLWFLPNDPGSCSFLTAEERRVAVKRIEAEQLSAKTEPTDFHSFKLAVLHVSTQLTGLASLCSLLGLNSSALFLPTLLKCMGFSKTRSQLLTVPVYAFSWMLCVTTSILSDRFKRRGIPTLISASFMVIGFAILASVESRGVRYFATFFSTTGPFVASPILLAWSVDNATGPAVRAIVAAYVVAAGNVGSVIATWTYLQKDAPRYLRGHYINLGFGALCLVFTSMLLTYLTIQNQRRSDGKEDKILEGLSQEEIDRLGHRHPDFRYTL